MQYRGEVIYWVKGSEQCIFCFEIGTPVERWGEKGEDAIFKTEHTEPLTQEIPSASALYILRTHVVDCTAAPN